MRSILSNKNKRGFAGLGFMVGIITSVMVFVMMSALLPTIIQMFNADRASNVANCAGYTSTNPAQSYNSSLSSDTITCSILNFGVGMWVLAIIFAVIAGVITGSFAQGFGQQNYQQNYQQPQQYGGY